MCETSTSTCADASCFATFVCVGDHEDEDDYDKDKDHNWDDKGDWDHESTQISTTATSTTL
ncbi:hypothetical protein VKS41_004603 [Umbelopsis sp. WA50703]|jgi:hypothetical protein